MESKTLSVLPDAAPVEKENSILIETVKTLAVTTKDEHAGALEMFRAIALREKVVKEFFKESKDKAHAAHKAICEMETKLLSPLSTARALVTNKINQYTAAEEARAREEQRKLDEMARKDAEERQLADAEQAQKEGKPEEAEAILNAETEIPIIRMPSRVAKVDGVGTQKRWGAELTDKVALIKWVAQHPENAELLDANMPALNKLAIALKAGFNIPGVKAVEKTSLTTRA